MNDLIRWEPNQVGIDYLVGKGRIERVQPSKEAATRLLSQARLHLQSAQALSTTADLPMAFVAAYDAARKSLAAILAVQGLRARGGDGGHLVLLDVVRPQFPDNRKELQLFDWLRTIRNDAQYPDFDTPSVTTQDVQDAIPAATDIFHIAESFVKQA